MGIWGRGGIDMETADGDDFLLRPFYPMLLLLLGGNTPHLPRRMAPVINRRGLGKSSLI